MNYTSNLRTTDLGVVNVFAEDLLAKPGKIDVS